MEDLCFAVLQPKDYRSLRQQLDRLWGTQSFPDLSRVLEAAFGGGQQTERVIKQLAGRRESPQELALRVAYSSNAVNAAKLLAPRKVRTPLQGQVPSIACIAGGDVCPWQHWYAWWPGLLAVHSVHCRQGCSSQGWLERHVHHGCAHRHPRNTHLEQHAITGGCIQQDLVGAHCASLVVPQCPEGCPALCLHPCLLLERRAASS